MARALSSTYREREMIDGKVRADIEGGKSSEERGRERERRRDGVWRSGVKENRVWKDWRETLE